jgi:hypothetical protein
MIERLKLKHFMFFNLFIMLIIGSLFYWFKSLTLTIIVYYIQIFLFICQFLIIAILIWKEKIRFALIAFLIVVVFSVINWGLYPLYIFYTRDFFGQ